MSNKFNLGRREFLRRLLELSAAGMALSLTGCATPEQAPSAQAETPAPAATTAATEVSAPTAAVESTAAVENTAAVESTAAVENTAAVE
ncbi:MAG: hypothetical protein JXM73_07685, partial [Anaerolineae bacterium]|nr:hypothetical protein [Anaerolineae bacterium]